MADIQIALTATPTDRPKRYLDPALKRLLHVALSSERMSEREFETGYAGQVLDRAEALGYLTVAPDSDFGAFVGLRLTRRGYDALGLEKPGLIAVAKRVWPRLSRQECEAILTATGGTGR